jgi:DNA-binding CsgD family transcriptional regulator
VTFDASVSTIHIGGETLITTVVREIAKRENVSSLLTFPGTAELSSRELEIVQLVLRGKRSKEIALALGISEKTVFTHRSRAYRKLSLRSDRELFRLAADLQLI